MMGRKYEATNKEGQSVDPLLSSCNLTSYLLSTKYGADLVLDPRDIHSLGTVFKVVSNLALGSIFCLKNMRRLIAS